MRSFMFEMAVRLRCSVELSSAGFPEVMCQIRSFRTPRSAKGSVVFGDFKPAPALHAPTDFSHPFEDLLPGRRRVSVREPRRLSGAGRDRLMPSDAKAAR